MYSSLYTVQFIVKFTLHYDMYNIICIIYFIQCTVNCRISDRPGVAGAVVEIALCPINKLSDTSFVKKKYLPSTVTVPS